MNVLGIDAGGSKTVYALCNEQGQVLARLSGEGFSPANSTGEELTQILKAQIQSLLQHVGYAGIAGTVDAVCAGMPCYGEDETVDEMLRGVLDAIFHGIPFEIVNDAQVAWAGSLAMRPGVNVVCGTGCITFGMDSSGRIARCGGWSHHFSDEGSGYWLGCKLVEIYCKQADGRGDRHGIVYRLVREHFQIGDDFAMVKMFERDFLPNRGKMAGLQRLLFDAAMRGDPDAVACYRQAANEIALNVKGILSQLNFEPPVSVSYSGGIFKVGSLLMEGFAEYVQSVGGRIAEPIAPPWAGALMMALRLIHRDTDSPFDRIVQSSKI